MYWMVIEQYYYNKHQLSQFEKKIMPSNTDTLVVFHELKPSVRRVDADHDYCLAPLGISKSAGNTRQPVLLGTAETEQVVKVFEGMKHMGGLGRLSGARLLPCSRVTGSPSTTAGSTAGTTGDP